MKKIGIIFTALLLFGVGNVYAQIFTSADVAVTALIEGSLTIENQNDLSFGTQSAGTTATIDEATSADAGKLALTGTAGSQVVVTAPASLTLTGAGDDITTSLAYIGNEADVQSTAAEGNLGAGGGNVTLSAGGLYFIWVGGSFTTPITQANGAYSATLTVEVQYL